METLSKSGHCSRNIQVRILRRADIARYRRHWE